MSILIKGMKMPENCGMCSMAHRNFDGNETRLACYALHKWAEESGDGRLTDCPLVELPEKHGRLIDEAMLRKSVLKWMPNDPCGREEKEFPFEEDICVSMMMEIEEQPTVLEAEGEG